jgi:16S rRNA G966 N2-methylase RsmD
MITSGKFNSWDRNKIVIAENLYKIRHWKIIQDDYKTLPNEPATWFIDPPYQFGGHRYVESNKKLNFVDLAQWCTTRMGQVIVCENTKASWLPFTPLAELHGQKHTTVEAVYYLESNGAVAVDLQPAMRRAE